MSRHIFLLTLPLLFMLTGCSTDELAMEDLVGIWRSASYEELDVLHRRGSVAVVYITDDGNLFVHHSSKTVAGVVTNTLHFHFEIEGAWLITTPVGEPGSHDVEISIRGERLRLDMHRNDNRARPPEFLFALYRAYDEVPYGWTDRDR